GRGAHPAGRALDRGHLRLPGSRRCPGVPSRPHRGQVRPAAEPERRADLRGLSRAEREPGRRPERGPAVPPPVQPGLEVPRGRAQHTGPAELVPSMSPDGSIDTVIPGMERERARQASPLRERRSKMAIVSVNPATEEQLASFEEHTWEQVDAALQRAYNARYA